MSRWGIRVEEDGKVVHSTQGVSSNLLVNSECERCGHEYKAGDIVINNGKNRCSLCGGKIKDA